MQKPCYSCEYRGTIPGDAHSCCNHPDSGSNDPMLQLLSIMASVGRVSPMVGGAAEKMGVQLNPHGVRNGWANWPGNFDPIWVEECKSYKPKG